MEQNDQVWSCLGAHFEPHLEVQMQLRSCRDQLEALTQKVGS